MKSYISAIILFCQNGEKRIVSLEPGVNIIVLRLQRLTMSYQQQQNGLLMNFKLPKSIQWIFRKT